jgi:transcriptional regulator with XRE-family HTH domain
MTTIVGRRVRELRTARDLTQAELSTRLGMCAGSCHISLIERGQVIPTDATLFRIATALDVPRTELVGRASGQADATQHAVVDAAVAYVSSLSDGWQALDRSLYDDLRTAVRQHLRDAGDPS